MFKQLRNEQEYWGKVLERVASVVKFLTEGGLQYRGQNEERSSVSNDNFLGTI
jgi:hypothetical protein